MNNLKNLRKRKGLSISKLHELTGIPIRTLEDWENERHQTLPYHRIKLLAEVLECGIEELMTKEIDCLYNEKSVSIYFTQEEQGVLVNMFEQEYSDPCLTTILPRETVLELLKEVKHGVDTMKYFQ